MWWNRVANGVACPFKRLFFVAALALVGVLAYIFLVGRIERIE